LLVPPGVELRTISIDTGAQFVAVTMNWKPFPFFPTLDGSNIAFQVGSDLLPAVESLGWIRPLNSVPPNNTDHPPSSRCEISELLYSKKLCPIESIPFMRVSRLMIRQVLERSAV
jgi:hypothetical protein